MEPGAETAERKRDAGEDEQRAAERDEAGEGLPEHAENLAGVGESHDRSQATPRALAGE